MDIKTLLSKSLDESQEYLTNALDELSKEELAWPPRVGSNSIIFIFWHVTRVEDIWINRVTLGREEVYESGGWQELLGTPAKESGFQYDLEKLQSWPVPNIDTLKGYFTAVRQETVAFISALDGTDLSRVARPGHRYDTVEAILSHLITEITLHVGQIDYLRGIIRGFHP